MEVTKEIMDTLALAVSCIYPEDIEKVCEEHFKAGSSDAYLYAVLLKHDIAKKGIVETYQEYTGDTDMQAIICKLLTKHS